MPDVALLPESLQPFAFRNAIRIDSGQDFDHHIQRLMRIVDGIVVEKATTTMQRASDAVVADITGDEGPKVARPFRSRLLMYAIGAVIVVGLGIMIVLAVSPRNPAREITTSAVPAKPPGEANAPTAPAPPRSPAPEEAVSTADAVKRASDAFGRKDYAEAMRWYR